MDEEKEAMSQVEHRNYQEQIQTVLQTARGLYMSIFYPIDRGDQR